MNAESLIMLYQYTYHVLQINAEGLTHEDSLSEPKPAGNCLNWVLGHILASRNRILSLVGEDPILSEEEAAPYQRGSKPIEKDSRALPLEKLLGDLDRSQERLTSGLLRMAPEALATAAADGSVGDKLAVLQFHEAYHAGQVGLLRRLAGKSGAIK